MRGKPTLNAIGERLPSGREEPRRGLSLAVRPPQLRSVLGFCLFETAFYFAFHYGMSFSHACASPFWFPDSVLLCALLLVPLRKWWLFVLGPLPIRLFSPIVHGLPPWFLLITFAIDSVKGLLLAATLRRFLRNPTRFETVQEFVLFCFFGVLLIPAASAFCGAAARHALGSDYWLSWQQWFMGNALSQIVVTPAILYWSIGFRWFGPPRNWKMPSAKRLVEGSLLATGLVLTGWTAFNTAADGTAFAESCFYAPVPLLFWAAIRFGMPGASGAVAVITFFSVNAAIQGGGPFFDRSPSATALALQEFLLLRAAPLYLVAILIHQSNRAERSLRESEERFRFLADSAPVLIWMARVDKLCEFFNRGWLEFTGRTMDQEFGNGWAEGVHPEDSGHCIETYNSCFDSRQPFEIEYRLRRHDGQYRWILDRGVPRYAPNGDFLGYVGSAIDITDRKEAEEARQNLVHASRLAVVGEFTAMIAHELNQPLGAILSNAEAAEMLLQLKTAPLEKVLIILSDIRRDDLRASEVISRLRGLLRRREMEMKSLDINELIAEVLRLARGDALRHKVLLHTDCRAAPALVLGDAVHLQQVVLNLILNGIEAMRENVKTDRHLFVSTNTRDDGFVEVAVKDIGNGIAPENLSHVFDSFFTTKREGMGIGLSVARSIVQLHSGSIWAEINREGRGVTFRFTVPLFKRSPSLLPRHPTRAGSLLTGTT